MHCNTDNCNIFQRNFETFCFGKYLKGINSEIKIFKYQFKLHTRRITNDPPLEKRFIKTPV